MTRPDALAEKVSEAQNRFERLETIWRAALESVRTKIEKDIAICETILSGIDQPTCNRIWMDLFAGGLLVDDEVLELLACVNSIRTSQGLAPLPSPRPWVGSPAAFRRAEAGERLSEYSKQYSGKLALARRRLLDTEIGRPKFQASDLPHELHDLHAEREALTAEISLLQRKCEEDFEAALSRSYLDCRIEDYAPLPNSDLCAILKTNQSRFIQQWAASHAGCQLDVEQAAAVGSVWNHTLVTARAGSGKTSTLVARTAFLLKHCRVRPDELLLLAFNKAAAEEMRCRLEKMGYPVPHVMTFHALAHAVIHPGEELIYDSADDARPARSREFQQVINDFQDNEERGKRVQSIMLGHFREDWQRLSLEGLTLNQTKGLDFRRCLTSESLGGEYVKSFGEKAIANYLFEHDLPYYYERNHWWSGRNYRPDFTIEHGGKKVVIEYFGLQGDSDYDQESEKKRQYWRDKPDYQFVELNPTYFKEGFESFRQKLRSRLEQCGLACQQLSEDEIWRRVKDRAVTQFAKMTSSFIGRCRKASLSPDALFERISAHRPVSQVESDFLHLATQIYSAYLERLSAGPTR